MQEDSEPNMKEIRDSRGKEWELQAVRCPCPYGFPVRHHAFPKRLNQGGKFKALHHFCLMT